MNKTLVDYLLLALPLGLACAVAPPAMAAADALVDDFSSGAYQSGQVNVGLQTAEQSGTMMGRYRDTELSICDKAVAGECASRNPFNQKSSYAIAASRDKGHPMSAFIQSIGYRVTQKTDVAYGFGPIGMVEDLSGGSTRRLRLSFDSLTAPMAVNAFLTSGGGWGEDACNVLPSLNAFVLEMPLSEFTAFSGGFIPGAVDHIEFAFYSGQPSGSVEFGITKVDVSDSSLPGAIHCGPMPQ